MQNLTIFLTEVATSNPPNIWTMVFGLLTLLLGGGGIVSAYLKYKSTKELKEQENDFELKKMEGDSIKQVKEKNAILIACKKQKDIEIQDLKFKLIKVENEKNMLILQMDNRDEVTERLLLVLRNVVPGTEKDTIDGYFNNKKTDG